MERCSDVFIIAIFVLGRFFFARALDPPCVLIALPPPYHLSISCNIKGCMIPGDSGLDGLVDRIVVPCTVLLAMGLGAAVIIALYASKIWQHSFGTLEYFLKVADCRRVGFYTSLLVGNFVIVMFSLVAVVQQVESDRREGNLSQKQYDNVYFALFVGYLLQFLAFGNLWSNRPPSTALKLYKDEFKVKVKENSNGVDDPQEILLSKLELKWSWYLTADDVLANAENGFLLYTFASRAGPESPLKANDGADAPPSILQQFKTLLKSTMSCTAQEKPELKNTYSLCDCVDREGNTNTVEGAKKPDNCNFEERYLAQKLGTRFWAGGLTMTTTGNEPPGSPAANSKPTSPRGTQETFDGFATGNGTTTRMPPPLTTTGNTEYLYVEGRDGNSKQAETFDGFATGNGTTTTMPPPLTATGNNEYLNVEGRDGNDLAHNKAAATLGLNEIEL